MNKIVFFLWMGLSISGLYAQQNKDLIITSSKDIAAKLISQSFDSIPRYFDSVLVNELPVEKLERDINGSVKIYGELKEAGQPVLEMYNENIMTRTRMMLTKTSMVLSLSYTPDGKVKGLFLSQYGGLYTIPGYVESLSFLENRYEFGKEGWKINGTLSYPRDQKKHPLVIIIHESGPMDRDGSTGSSMIYRDLAWGLSTQGICVFRYDKRSNVHGGKLFMEAYKGNDYTPYDEIVEDVFSAIELMKKNPHVDSNQIILVGHGQGGMMAPLIVKTAHVKGMVLLAANARPLQDMMIEQMNYLYPEGTMTLNQYNEKRDIIHRATYAKRKKLPVNTPTDSLPFGVRAGYWNYLNKYNQLKDFGKLTLPTLVLQGERDYQVTMTDYHLWEKVAKKRKGPTQFISYRALNHLFIPGEGRSSREEYQVPGNLDGKVVNDILEWINSLN
jgi:predicted esterase